MNRLLRALSVTAVFSVVGCGGDSAGNNALPAVQSSGETSGAADKGKAPAGKNAGTNAPQGEEAMKAL